MMTLGISAMAKGTGEVGSVGSDINSANVRKMVLADKAVKALYVQYSSINYNKGCTDTVVEIDLKSMSFIAEKSCYEGDGLGESMVTLQTKGLINRFSDSKKLENIYVTTVEFSGAG